MKFSSSLLAAMLVTCSAWADTHEQMPPQFKPYEVVLESPKNDISVRFDALVMQPYANNLDYAAEALPFDYGINRPITSPSWVIPDITTGYHFGFVVGLVGILHDTNSNIMLNWERYHSPDDTGSLSVPSASDMIGPFFEIGPDASPYKMAKGTVSFDFDQVNLDYGTFVRFGSQLNMNLYSGVSFARIKENRYTRFSNTEDTVIRTLTVPSTFTGAGPQIGFDSTYKIVKGFQFIANASASLFVGTFKNNTTFTTQSSTIERIGDQNPNTQSTTVDNKMGIVPGLDGTLGLAYDFTFSDHYEFKIEAGYRAQLFINAIRSIDMGSEVALGPIGSIGSAEVGVYARTFERTISDFALAGPYATITFGF